MSQVPSQVVLVNELPAWLSVQQAAAYCGVDHGEMYHKMLRNLEIRRIGVRGVTPYGRLIRIKRESVIRLRGQPETPSAELSRWVTINQAAEHYQVSTRLIRELIAHEQVDARRIGDSKIIRIERDSLLALGRLRRWGADCRPWSVPARPARPTA